MRFTIPRERLLEALGAILPAVAAAKSSVPVLTHCLVETTTQGIRMTGADFEHQIAAEVPADVSEPGAATMPARKLQEIAAKLPAAPVTFSAKGDRVAIACGSARFTLAGFSPKECAPMPAVRFDQASRIQASDLRALVANVAYAASNEDSRPILGGVLWEFHADKMRMVATNAHRLAMMDQPVTSGVALPSVIVPPWALEQAVKLFPGEEEVEVARGDNHLAFRSPTRTLVTRLIEGPYPHYEQIIPRDHPHVATLDRAAFIDALARVATATPDVGEPIIRLSLNPGMVKLFAKSPDMGDAHDECAARYDGEPLEIGLSAPYLLELLRRMPGEEITMAMKSPERAIVCEPSANGAGTHLAILMPIRLNK